MRHSNGKWRLAVSVCSRHSKEARDRESFFIFCHLRVGISPYHSLTLYYCYYKTIADKNKIISIGIVVCFLMFSYVVVWLTSKNFDGCWSKCSGVEFSKELNAKLRANNNLMHINLLQSE